MFKKYFGKKSIQFNKRHCDVWEGGRSLTWRLSYTVYSFSIIYESLNTGWEARFWKKKKKIGKFGGGGFAVLFLRFFCKGSKSPPQNYLQGHSRGRFSKIKGKRVIAKRKISFCEGTNRPPKLICAGLGEGTGQRPPLPEKDWVITFM